jgi:AraC-like DNA-binding protein
MASDAAGIQIGSGLPSRSPSIGARGPRDKSVCEHRLLVQLVCALLAPDEARDVLRGMYTHALHAKLLQCLERIRNEDRFADSVRKPTALPDWRLQRVVGLVERDLDRPISLSCLARAAGLSPMHFAALFRQSTGLRPHEFIVQRRVERARLLLSESRLPIVEIALSVGFQSQAHFTSVFKRLVGTTPHRWRLGSAEGGAEGSSSFLKKRTKKLLSVSGDVGGSC